jgi:hypothetical protein
VSELSTARIAGEVIDPKPESTFGNAWLPWAGTEKGNRSAAVPASGINRMCPVTVLMCGFETIRVSPLPAATRVTTVAADAVPPIARAHSATARETRCTNPRRWRRV